MEKQKRGELKVVPISKLQRQFSACLRMAEGEGIIITRHGKPAGLLIGFKDEDAWLEYRLQHDPRFLKRIDAARKNLRAGKGVRIEDLS